MSTNNDIKMRFASRCKVKAVLYWSIVEHEHTNTKPIALSGSIYAYLSLFLFVKKAAEYTIFP